MGSLGLERTFAIVVGSVLVVLGVAGSLGNPIVGGPEQTGLIVTASVCAALTVLLGEDAGWLAVPVAASAGLVSFLAAVDSVVASERLAQHYERTVARLELIDRSLDETGSRGDVEEVETVLMAEHRAWRRIAEGNQQ